VPAAALIAALALPAVAQQPSPGELAIKYRQAMYKVMYGNFAQAGSMVAGRVQFDAKRIAVTTDRVTYLFQMIPEGFAPESKEGAPSKAKPEIWTDRMEFNRLMKDMQAKASKLATASKARGVTAEKLKGVFKEAGDACKACHDKFKAE
jgi:cytochrome c556